MSNMKVGHRLVAGFACVFAFLILVAGISVYRMQEASAITDQVMKDKLKTERMLTEWRNIIEVNAARTLAAGKASDPAVQAMFEESIKRSSARVSELLGQLQQTLTDPASKSLMDASAEKRAAYQAARKEAFQKKESGDIDGANRFFDQELAPRAGDYVASVNKIVEHQQHLIDAMGDEIRSSASFSIALVVGLGIAALVIGSGLAYLIAASVLAQLGGEPSYAAEVAERIASGDLSMQVDLRQGDQSSLLFAMKKMRDSLARIVAEVRTGADSIASASTQIASGNLDLSSRTESQASSLEETVSTMEELTSSVKQNADNAQQANSLALSASKVAGHGGAVVSEVVATMESINESAMKIVDIISVIDGIAFQTNILALNAAVEAARAGEQGRGFAVVAAEVRNLAQRSAAAAKEIKALIDNSVEKVAGGSRLVNQAGATMSEVVESVQRVADVIAEITAASGEQASGIEQINTTISQMDEVTQRNAALVEEAAAASQSLQDQATSLSQLVSVFKLDGLQSAAAATRAAATAASAPQPHVTSLAAARDRRAAKAPALTGPT